MSGSESTKDPSYQVPERPRPPLTNHRNLAYNILKYLEDEMVRDKEISDLGPCSECTNDISLKAFTILSCGHLFHRLCIEKKLMITRPDVCPFPDCEKKVDTIYPVSTSTRRDSQSSQSSGTSALSNLMGEKFNLISPIPEDPMEEVENTPIQEKRLFCAKCSEEITEDFPKDTVFLSCKHAVHYECIDNPHKKCPICPSVEDSSKKRANTSTEKSSSKKQKTSDKEGDSAMLKKLVKELKDDSINQELSFPTQSPEDSYTHLYKEIVEAETQNDSASQRVLLCYFQFGKKIYERLDYYKNEKKYRDRMAQSKVDKEIKEQLPEEVTDTTRWKQTVRA